MRKFQKREKIGRDRGRKKNLRKNGKKKGHGKSIAQIALRNATGREGTFKEMSARTYERRVVTRKGFWTANHNPFPS